MPCGVSHERSGANEFETARASGKHACKPTKAEICSGNILRGIGLVKTFLDWLRNVVPRDRWQKTRAMWLTVLPR